LVFGNGLIEQQQQAVFAGRDGNRVLDFVALPRVKGLRETQLFLKRRIGGNLRHNHRQATIFHIIEQAVRVAFFQFQLRAQTLRQLLQDDFFSVENRRVVFGGFGISDNEYSIFLNLRRPALLVARQRSAAAQ